MRDVFELIAEGTNGFPQNEVARRLAVLKTLCRTTSAMRSESPSNSSLSDPVCLLGPAHRESPNQRSAGLRSGQASWYVSRSSTAIRCIRLQNRIELCRACDTIILSDRLLCCSPQQLAEHRCQLWATNPQPTWSSHLQTSYQRASADPPSLMGRACSATSQQPVATASRFTPERMKEVARGSTRR